MPPTGCTRQYDYSLRDQSFFIDTWKKLNVGDSQGDTADEKDTREQVESYFDTGLNVENALSSKRGHADMSAESKKSGKRAAPGSAENARLADLPRFGLVEKLQIAFGIPDLLKDNPFLSKEAANKRFKCQKAQKRVRFAKVEISEKHQPNCRRRNFEKEEFGHFHAPTCSNYKSEQLLCKQEFLIRGNFIRENARKATSETDFYYTPVRPLEPLDSSLVTPTSPHPLHLNLKNTGLDSITIHDKNSPGLRNTPMPVKETEKEIAPPSRPSTADSFAPNPNYRPMPCQPIFSDDIIIGSPPSIVVDNKEDSSLTGTTTQSDLQEPPIPEISVIPAAPASEDVCDKVSCDELKLSPEEPQKKARTGSDSGSIDSGLSSVDSGYDDKDGDFVSDFLSSLSDSESESESEETCSDSTSTVQISVKPAVSGDNESETVISPISSPSPRSVELSSSDSEEEADLDCKEVDEYLDSGIGSLSDNEDDINDLIKTRTSVRSARPAPTKPHTWLLNKSDSDKPAQIPVKCEETETISEESCFLIRQGYVNPFSKKPADQPVGVKTAPSVLGRLICDTGSQKSELVRNPDLAPDRFLFDSPSPDDIVRIRQSGVVTC